MRNDTYSTAALCLALAQLHSAQLHDAQLHGAQSHGAQSHGAQSHGAQLHGAMLQAVAVALYNPEGFRTFGQARLDVGRVLPEQMSDESYRELLVRFTPAQSVTLLTSPAVLRPASYACHNTAFSKRQHGFVIARGFN